MLEVLRGPWVGAHDETLLALTRAGEGLEELEARDRLAGVLHPIVGVTGRRTRQDRLVIRDERFGGQPLHVTFHGELRPEQQLAAEMPVDIFAHPTLVALPYRTLDVEQIGSVYEALMGFAVKRIENGFGR